MKPVVVAPPERSLFLRLRGLPVVARAETPAEVSAAVALASETGAELVAVLVDTSVELADLFFADLPAATPLALRLDGGGPVRRLARIANDLRRLNARYYLPCRSREDAAEIRVLASLGLNLAADLTAPGEPDWDALAELAVYALFNSVGHGDIDPFAFLGRRFDRDRLPLDPRAAFFAAPGKFLWADAAGALSTPTFAAGPAPFPFAIEDLGGDAAAAALDEARDGWREFFIEPHPCSSCPGFRVCLGLFASETGDGCRGLMTEALAGAEREAATRRSRVEPWRP